MNFILTDKVYCNVEKDAEFEICAEVVLRNTRLIM
jgi:hypothetical protein